MSQLILAYARARAREESRLVPTRQAMQLVKYLPIKLRFGAFWFGSLRARNSPDSIGKSPLERDGSAGTRTRNQPRKLSGLLYQINQLTATRTLRGFDFFFASEQFLIFAPPPSKITPWQRATQLSHQICVLCDCYRGDVPLFDDPSYPWNQCNVGQSCHVKCKPMPYSSLGRPGLEPGTNALKGRCSTD